MARSLRIEFNGAFYHVMSRGNEKKAIFRTRRDREKFLEYVEMATVRYGAVVHCYCLMENHYHLLIETPGANLARIMRHINGAYSVYFNTKHKRAGHLFQGRYRSILVDTDIYLTELTAYIHQNPVEAGLASCPEDYEWSSFASYLGLADAPQWLKTDFVLAVFGEPPQNREHYRRYVEHGGMARERLNAGLSASPSILGDDEFVEKIKTQHLAEQQASRDLPQLNALLVRPLVEQVDEKVSDCVADDARIAKKMTIYICHRHLGCSLREIGGYFGVCESAVVANSNRFANLLYRDQSLAETVAELLVVLKV